MSTDAYRHTVTPQHPGPNVPDGDGGYTNTWIDLVPPTWACSIDPASVRDLERVQAGTVLATASYVIKGRYRPDITTATRLLFNGRRFSVTGVGNPEERNISLELVAVEIVT
jgi:SPP1 family predicted phage head-tail adaptor